eukprot:4523817-Pleurochrysis_carterae.AAC.1
MQPAEVSDGHEWALIHVVPIKDTSARAKPTPMPLRRRRRGGWRGEDPMCAYDALRAMWEERVHLVPCAERTFCAPSSTRCSSAPTACCRGRLRTHAEW